jgi:hypothetical protein
MKGTGLIWVMCYTAAISKIAANLPTAVNYLTMPNDSQEKINGVKRIIVASHYYQPYPFCSSKVSN